MFNLNNGLLSVPGGEAVGATPRTPEILNSLIAMTNPFDNYRTTGGSLGASLGPRIASSPPSDSNSNSGSSPPSVQHTCSQLIKEGLKHTIQTKRKRNPGEETLVLLEPPKPQTKLEEVSPGSLGTDAEILYYCDGLTPEDEERRRRRRERNKIAATKCRLKKREKTVHLVMESEQLETQNKNLKTLIQELETQRRRLVDTLTVHRPNCSHHPYESTPTVYHDTKPLSATPGPVVIESTSTTFYSSTTHFKEEVVESRGPEYHPGDHCYLRREGMEDGRYPCPSSEPYTYEDGVMRDPGVMLPYCPMTPEGGKTYTRNEAPLYTSISLDNPHPYMRGQDSPLGNYSRPSNLSVNTSSSDYESNTEVLDSPSSIPPSYHHFDDDTDSFSAGYSTSSCIS